VFSKRPDNRFVVLHNIIILTMETVPASFQQLLERASNSFDDGFKKATYSFDEGFKQIQSKYDEVMGSANPFFMAPDSTDHQKEVASKATPSKTNGSVPRFHDYAASPSKNRDKTSSGHSSLRITSTTKKRSNTIPIRTYNEASPSNTRQLETTFSTSSIRKPFDECSDSGLWSNSIVQKQEEDEDRLSDEETTDMVSKSAANNTATIDSLLGYKPPKTITRSKLYITQPVGLDFMTLNTQLGTMLIVSKIEPTSIFATSGVKVGDAILSINGVSFRHGGGGKGDNICRPDAEIARKLLEKGWDGLPRDHRGRNSPSPDRRRFLHVTLEYRKFGGEKPTPSPAFEDLGRSAKLASTFSTVTKTKDNTTYVTDYDDDDDDEDKCAPDPCSSAAAAAVIAVASNPATPSKKDRKSIWGPAKAFLKLNRSKEQSPRKTKADMVKAQSPPKLIVSQTKTSNSSPATPSTPSAPSRLEEIRARNHQLRQQIETSKKRLLSTHIASSKRISAGDNYSQSCDSPDNLAQQLDLDKKELFDQKVESITKELLSSVEMHQVSMLSPVLDSSGVSEDDYHLARNEQEALITSVNNMSTSLTSFDELDKTTVATEESSSQKTPSRQNRANALLDDASWTTVELLEAEAQKRNAAQILGEHHQELTRLNKKVSEKLRSKVDLLKRSNMKLSEEIAVLRIEDKKKTSMLTNWQKQMEESQQTEENLKKDVALYQSRLRICSLQSDKRQQELLDQIEKQRQATNDRVELLLQRVSSLERSNRKLMSKLQTAESKRNSREEMETELKQLRKTVDSQSSRIESLLDSNNKLLKKSMDLEKLYNAEKEQSSQESLVAEIAIVSARSSFLERQVGYLKDQLKCAKAEAQEERGKRLFCQRKLEDALVEQSEGVDTFLLNATSATADPWGYGVSSSKEAATSGQGDGMESVKESQAHAALSPRDIVNGQAPTSRGEKNSSAEDDVTEEKKTMEMGEW
jgi:hypothetical protein